MNAISGTLQECATHWNATYENAGGFRLLEQFTGASERTATRWFSNNTWPKGIGAIKLMVFVQLFGYIVAEAKKIDVDIMLANRAIAFGVLTPEEAQKLLRMPSDSVARILRGRVHTSSKRVEQLRRYLREHREQIEASEKSWKEKIDPLLGVRAHETSASREITPTPVPTAASAKIVDSLVSIFNSISNIASIGIDPLALTDEVKQHIAYTTAQLFKKFGIDPVTIERLRHQQAKGNSNMSDLARVLLTTTKET
jgi:hypothetical protein